MKAVLSRSYMLTVGVGKYCTTCVSKRHRLHKRSRLSLHLVLLLCRSMYGASLIDGRRGQVEWSFFFNFPYAMDKFESSFFAANLCLTQTRKRENEDRIMFTREQRFPLFNSSRLVSNVADL